MGGVRRRTALRWIGWTGGEVRISVRRWIAGVRVVWVGVRTRSTWRRGRGRRIERPTSSWTLHSVQRSIGSDCMRRVVWFSCLNRIAFL